MAQVQAQNDWRSDLVKPAKDTRVQTEVRNIGDLYSNDSAELVLLF